MDYMGSGTNAEIASWYWIRKELYLLDPNFVNYFTK